MCEWNRNQNQWVSHAHPANAMQSSASLQRTAINCLPLSRSLQTGKNVYSKIISVTIVFLCMLPVAQITLLNFISRCFPHQFIKKLSNLKKNPYSDWQYCMYKTKLYRGHHIPRSPKVLNKYVSP